MAKRKKHIAGSKLQPGVGRRNPDGTTTLLRSASGGAQEKTVTLKLTPEEVQMVCIALHWVELPEDGDPLPVDDVDQLRFKILRQAKAKP